MNIKLDRNSRKALLEIKGLSRATERAVDLAAFEAGKTIQKATNTEILRKPKSGFIYVSRNRNGSIRRHRASAPGETHANFSGTLRRTLGYKVKGGQIEFGYGVVRGDAPAYAGALEFGSPTIQRRPTLQNGVNETQARVVQDIQRSLERAYK